MNDVRQMLNHPFNPNANFTLASRLAAQKDPRQIQEYLDRRGVLHFSAEDIVNLNTADIFFYLTRFYGPPVEGDLKTLALQRSYEKRATNPQARSIVQNLAANIVTYRSFKREFDLFFNRIVQNPGDLEIWQSLGATSQERFYSSFFNYLRLLRRRQGLPPLTLHTIKQLRPMTENSIVGLLTQYNDNEVIQLVGNEIDREQTRPAFLNAAANILLQTRVFVMQPYEARLCNNTESVYTADEFAELNYPFLGRGSFAGGFDCYTVEDLFSAWELNRDADGEVAFIDPLHPQATFRVNDLKDFRKALAAGRAGVAVPREIIERFDNYIRLAETQESSDHPKIRRLRQWANENPRNRDLLRSYWTTYFYMGLYMRQWRGPGHPYPVQKIATGREAEVGSNLELQIATNVQQENIKLLQIIDQLPEEIQNLINTLTVVRRHSEQVESERVSIAERYNRVINQNNYCIRMASGPWSYTGAYYLKQILNEQIPGFDLGANVEFIF